MQRAVNRLDEDPRRLPLTGLAVAQKGRFWRGTAVLPTKEDWRQNGGSDRHLGPWSATESRFAAVRR